MASNTCHGSLGDDAWLFDDVGDPIGSGFRETLPEARELVISHAVAAEELLGAAMALLEMLERVVDELGQTLELEGFVAPIGQMWIVDRSA